MADVAGREGSTLDEVREAYEEGAYDHALSLIATLDLESRSDIELSRLARDCYMRKGEISRALAEVTKMRRGSDSDGLRRQARFIVGRLRETAPSWLPPVARTSETYEPRQGVVLHLLKESLPYAQSGYTLRSRMTLEAQRRAGFEPVVVTSLGFPEYRGVAAASMESVEGIRHHRLPAPPGLDLPVQRIPYDILLSDQAELTSRVVAEERPSLIHAASGFRGFDQALVGLSLARAFDLPLIYEVRGFLEATWSSRPDLQERGEYYRRRRQQDERCMREAAVVVTIADSMRDELVRRGIPAEKIHVIPNAVDVDRFRPRDKDLGLARRLGVGDRFVVGYVSNIGKREGIEHLIRATSRLRAAGREVACLIVGDGPERESLVSLASSLGLDGDVVMPGHVPNSEIEQYYALIDAFVVPRVDDQAARLVTPLKPLEAMAMRIPVIVSDLPALRELVEPGVRGLAFEPGDEAGLAETISDLMDEPAVGLSLADAAQTWVKATRTVSANVERYQAAIGSALAGG